MFPPLGGGWQGIPLACPQVLRVCRGAVSPLCREWPQSDELLSPEPCSRAYSRRPVPMQVPLLCRGRPGPALWIALAWCSLRAETPSQSREAPPAGPQKWPHSEARAPLCRDPRLCCWLFPAGGWAARRLFLASASPVIILPLLCPVPGKILLENVNSSLHTQGHGGTSLPIPPRMGIGGCDGGQEPPPLHAPISAQFRRHWPHSATQEDFTGGSDIT